MFTFRAKDHIPRFILEDKNGKALAKAIEAAMQYANDRAADGAACVLDFDAMPEWRLDELAWEYNCLYDYTADIETKRQWIKNAVPLYRLFGTVQAIYQYVGGYFSGMDVEENWQYGGEPYHFRVTVEGEWTPGKEAWTRKAVEEAKNVRSVLDSLRVGHKCFLGISAECTQLGRFYYPMTSGENYAGRWPQINTIGSVDDTGNAGVDAGAIGTQFPYPITGTRPEINTAAAIDDSGRAGFYATDEDVKFQYPMPGETAATGQWPEVNTIGVSDKNNISAANAEDTYAKIVYKMCGADEM